MGSMVEFYDIVALVIRIGFWLYYNYNKEPQNSVGNHYGPWPLYYSSEFQTAGAAFA